MTPIALWLPFVVADVEAAVDFWEHRLGLPRVDEWSRDGERGVVFGASAGAAIEFVEVSRPAASVEALSDRGCVSAPTVALEFETWDEVDARYLDLAGPDDRKPARHPRGHYGFTLRDPHGIDVFLWSERRMP